MEDRHSAPHAYKKAILVVPPTKTDHILIFNSKTTWDYDPELGRNATRNGWMIKLLANEEVPLSCIELMPVNEGFFESFSEARDAAKYLKEKSYKSVVLLSSPCHSGELQIFLDIFRYPYVYCKFRGSVSIQ